MLANTDSRLDGSGNRDGMVATRVLLADDHPLYRRGLRTLLSTFSDIEVVGEASTGEDVISLSEMLQPDVIMMDLQMPGVNGIEATRRITQCSPETGVLVATMFEDDHSIHAAIWAGARGYILKDADEEEIVRAVRAVGHGQAIFSSDTVRKLLPYLAQEPRAAITRACSDSAECEEELLSSRPENWNGLRQTGVQSDSRKGANLEDALPESEVRTFLMADVRGYTRFTLDHGDEAAADLVNQFADLTEDVVRTRSGRLIELRGDEALAVFSSTRHAIRAALDLQQRFASETERNPKRPFAVGIGLDAGEAVAVKSGYRGTVLNLAARLCALAGPGEVLVSETVVALARKIEGVQYIQRTPVDIKGFDQPIAIFEPIREARGLCSPAAEPEATKVTEFSSGRSLGQGPDDSAQLTAPGIGVLGPLERYRALAHSASS